MNPIITTQDPTQKSNLFYGGTINVGGTPPKTDIKAFNQQMVNAQPGQSNFKIPPVPPVVSNANVVTKIPEITGKHTEQVNKSGSTPPLPGTTAYTQANTQTQTPPTGTSDTYTLPQGAVDQGNGTVLYQGRYFSKDALTNPENIAGLANYNLDKKEIDDALKSQLDAINKRFEQYKQTQEKINTSQVGGVRNALLQSEGGNRGSVAQFAAATSDDRVRDIMEEGQKALQELDIQRDQLLSAAKDAYRTQNYKLLDTLNAQIEKTVADKREVLKKKSEEIEKETKQAEKDAAISEEINSGITDPIEIMRSLKNKGITSTAKEINDTVGLLTGLGGTGIVAEYNYYKAEAKKAGITPVDFSTYQNQDANRKAVATGLGGVGVTGINYSPAQSKAIDKANMDVSKNATYSKTNNMKTFIQNVLTALSQENGVADIAAINQFQKIIDEGAVTRDQDVVLLQGAQSLASTLGLKIESLKAGDKLSPSQREQMKTLINEIYDAQLKALENDPFISATKKSLERNGIATEDTIIGELDGFGNSTTNSLLDVAKKDEEAFASLKNNPPEVQEEIAKRYNDLQQILGRPPTASEYFEANPWDRPKTSASVSVTDPKKGIVGNINLKGYATDPNQIKAVATIYEQVPETDNALDYTKFIKSISPKSPIKGEDILQVADTFQLDPKILIALMQHESNLGTSSVALANNNYGGITWSESYARNNPGVTKGTPRPRNEGGYYVKFATPLDGLMAQAKLLSNRKIA